MIPNMDVWRPCDTVETAVAWTQAIERRDGPSCLLFSRQNLAFQKRANIAMENIRRGGYELSSAQGDLKVVIIATGSEVSIAVDAQAELAQRGLGARVVSMPCTQAFDRQDAAYRTSVLPAGIPRISVEAGVTDGWRKYVGLEGATVGIDTFGESAPAVELYRHFNITAEHIVETAIALLAA
jgi:transketolase